MTEYEHEEEDLYIDQIQRSTGDRKRTALFVLGGAAIGSFIGDALGVSEHQIVSEVQWDGGEYGDFTNTYTRVFEDRGGILDLAGDNGSWDGYIDSIEREATLNDAIDSISVTDNLDYAWETTTVGGLGGAAGGFGADYFSRKLKETEVVEDDTQEGEE